MSIQPVPDALDRTVGSAGVLVQAVLDGVPREPYPGEALSGRVNLTRPERPLSTRERLDHCFMNSAGARPDAGRPILHRNREEKSAPRAASLIASASASRLAWITTSSERCGGAERVGVGAGASVGGRRRVGAGDRVAAGGQPADGREVGAAR
jgi:hypothetical protein